MPTLDERHDAIRKRIAEERQEAKAESDEVYRVASKLVRFDGVGATEALNAASKLVRDPGKFDAADPKFDMPDRVVTPPPPAAPDDRGDGIKVPSKGMPTLARERSDLEMPLVGPEGTEGYEGEFYEKTKDALRSQAFGDPDEELTEEEYRRRLEKVEAEARRRVAQQTQQTRGAIKPVIVADQEKHFEEVREGGMAIPFTGFRPGLLPKMTADFVEDKVNRAMGITDEEDQYKPVSAVLDAGYAIAAPVIVSLEPGFSPDSQDPTKSVQDNGFWGLLEMSPFVAPVAWAATNMDSESEGLRWGSDEHMKLAAETSVFDWANAPSTLIDNNFNKVLEAKFGAGLDEVFALPGMGVQAAMIGAKAPAYVGGKMREAALGYDPLAPITPDFQADLEFMMDPKKAGGAAWRNAIDIMTMGPLIVAEPMPAVGQALAMAKGVGQLKRVAQRAGIEAERRAAVQAMETFKKLVDEGKTIEQAAIIVQNQGGIADHTIQAWKQTNAMNHTMSLVREGTERADAAKRAAQQQAGYDLSKGNDPVKYQEAVTKARKTAVEARQNATLKREAAVKAATELEEAREALLEASRAKGVSHGSLNPAEVDPKELKKLERKKRRIARRRARAEQRETESVGADLAAKAQAFKDADKRAKAANKELERAQAAKTKADEALAQYKDYKPGGEAAAPTKREAKVLDDLDELRKKRKLAKDRVKSIELQLAADNPLNRTKLEADLAEAKVRLDGFQQAVRSAESKQAVKNRDLAARKKGAKSAAKQVKLAEEEVAAAVKGIEDTYLRYWDLRSTVGQDIASRYDRMTPKQIQERLKKLGVEARGASSTIRPVEFGKFKLELDYVSALVNYNKKRNLALKLKASSEEAAKRLAGKADQLQDLVANAKVPTFAMDSADQVIRQVNNFADLQLTRLKGGRRPAFESYRPQRDSIFGELLEMDPENKLHKVKDVDKLVETWHTTYGYDMPEAIETMVRRGEVDHKTFLKALDDEEAAFNRLASTKGERTYGAGRRIHTDLQDMGYKRRNETRVPLSVQGKLLLENLDRRVNNSISAYVGDSGPIAERMYRSMVELDRNAELDINNILASHDDAADALEALDDAIFTDKQVVLPGELTRPVAMNAMGAPADRAVTYLRNLARRGPEAFLEDPIVEGLATIALPRGRAAGGAKGQVTKSLASFIKKLEQTDEGIDQIRATLRQLQDRIDAGDVLTDAELNKFQAASLAELYYTTNDGALLKNWIDRSASIYYGMTGAADKTYRAQLVAYRAIVAAANVEELGRLAYKAGAPIPPTAADGSLAKALDYLTTRTGGLTQARGFGNLKAEALEDAQDFLAAYNLGSMDKKSAKLAARTGEYFEQSNQAMAVTEYANKQLVVPKAIRDIIMATPQGIRKEARRFAGDDEGFVMPWLDRLGRAMRVSQVMGVKIPRLALGFSAHIGDAEQVALGNWGDKVSGADILMLSQELASRAAGSAARFVGQGSGKGTAFWSRLHDLSDEVVPGVVGSPTYKQLYREMQLAGVVDSLPQAELTDLMREHTAAMHTGYQFASSKLGRLADWWMTPTEATQIHGQLMEHMQYSKRAAAYAELRKHYSPEESGRMMREALFDWTLGVSPFEAQSIGKISAYWTYRRAKWNYLTQAIGRDLAGIEKGDALKTLLHPESARTAKMTQVKANAVVMAGSASGEDQDREGMSIDDKVLLATRNPWSRKRMLIGSEKLDINSDMYQSYEDRNGRTAWKVDKYLVAGSAEDMAFDMVMGLAMANYIGRNVTAAVDSLLEGATGADLPIASEATVPVGYRDITMMGAEYVKDSMLGAPQLAMVVDPAVDHMLETIGSDPISFDSEFVAPKDTDFLEDIGLLDVITHVDAVTGRRKYGGSHDGDTPTQAAAFVYRCLTTIGAGSDLRREHANFFGPDGSLSQEGRGWVASVMWGILRHTMVQAEFADPRLTLQYAAKDRAYQAKEKTENLQKDVIPGTFRRD